MHRYKESVYIDLLEVLALFWTLHWKAEIRKDLSPEKKVIYLRSHQLVLMADILDVLTCVEEAVVRMAVRTRSLWATTPVLSFLFRFWADRLERLSSIHFYGGKADQVLVYMVLVTIRNLRVVVKMTTMMMVMAVMGVMVVMFFLPWCRRGPLNWGTATSRRRHFETWHKYQSDWFWTKYGHYWWSFVQFFCCLKGIQCLFMNITTLRLQVHCWMCERRRGRRLKIFSAYRLWFSFSWSRSKQ